MPRLSISELLRHTNRVVHGDRRHFKLLWIFDAHGDRESLFYPVSLKRLPQTLKHRPLLSVTDSHHTKGKKVQALPPFHLTPGLSGSPLKKIEEE